MCRFLVYSGPPICCADLLFRPTNSIVRQSFDAKFRQNGAKLENPYCHGSLNADGFGMAFYGSFEGETSDQEMLPCVFTDLLPAWNSKNLRRLSEKVHARLLFAHIRAAGPCPDGHISVCDCKTHPFSFGRYTFMHNGEIAGFAQVRRILLGTLKKNESFDLAMRCGATDTAVAFAIFCDQLSSKTEEVSPARLLEMLKQTVKVICQVCEDQQVVGTCKLNFVVTDGKRVIASRYAFNSKEVVSAPSLYYACGSKFAKASNSDYRIFHSERFSRMTIVSSEPLTEVNGDWVAVPENHVVLIVCTGEVLCAPFYHQFEPCLLANNRCKEVDWAISNLGMRMMGTQNRPPTPSGRRLDRFHSSLDFTSANPSVIMEITPSQALPFHTLANSGQVTVSGMVQISNLLFVSDAGVCGGNVSAYSLDTFELVAWSRHYGILSMASYGNYLFGSRSDGKICIWKVDQPQGQMPPMCIITIPHEIGHVLTMQVLSMNMLIMGSQDGNLRLVYFDMDSEEEDGKIVFDDENTQVGEMRRCRAKRGDCASLSSSSPVHFASRSHAGLILASILFQDFLFTAGSCSLIKRWDISQQAPIMGECLEVLGGHHRAVTDLCVWSQKNLLLSCSLDGTVRAWQVSAGLNTFGGTNHVQTFYGTNNGGTTQEELCCLSEHPRGFCAGTASGLVLMWFADLVGDNCGKPISSCDFLYGLTPAA